MNLAKEILVSINPKVSIVIPVYNGSDYLREAIDSALAQTYPNIEIIVVNDGSDDVGKTERIALSYGKKIHYFSKKNGGVATALNLAISEMTGDYFSWLSHDDAYYPNKISEQIGFFNTQSETIDLVYSDVAYIDKNSKFLSSTNHQKNHRIDDLNRGIYPVLKGIANGCSMLTRKKTFEKIGLFDETLKTASDYDMWFRIFRVCNIRYLAKVLIKSRLHEKQGTRTCAAYLEESNALWIGFFKKLTQEEILAFNDSLFSFYFEMARQMRLSAYAKASAFAMELARIEYGTHAPKVSVIMPCFNTAQFLIQAIDSILTQTYPDLELIVINDASSDGSRKILESFQEKNFRIRVFTNEQNKGISESMNVGLQQARGEYVARMDSDDIALPEKIAKQVQFLDTHADFGICSVNLLGIDKEGAAVPGTFYPPTDVPINWLFLWKNPIPNAPTMYRKSILEGIAFDKKFSVSEDYDFLCKLILITKVHKINDVLYHYRIHRHSMFQKYANLSGENLIIIGRRLAENLTNTIPPKFHDGLILTGLIAYYSVQGNSLKFFQARFREQQSCSPLTVATWLEKLLLAGKKKWNWSDTELEKARTHADEMLMRYFRLLYQPPSAAAKTISRVKNLLRRILKIIKIV